ncbi:hypothetical protein L7F22_020474 [Adiantum nelumboides]|nr:hypothetical protein [Adiantum nelumboides]
MVEDELFSSAAKFIYKVTAAPALDLNNIPLDKARKHLAKWLNRDSKPTIADSGDSASVPDSSHAHEEWSTAARLVSNFFHHPLRTIAGRGSTAVTESDRCFTFRLQAIGDNNNIDVLSPVHKQHLSLCKVPPNQRKANSDAYTPFLFSLGPYHEDYIDPIEKAALPQLVNSALADGAYLKQMTAKGLLSDKQLQDLESLINKKKTDILAQYVHRLNVHTYKDNRLARLLALDAITMVAAVIFMEELQSQHNLTSLNYPVARLVLDDAMLLENQIPVFLLDLAFQSILGGFQNKNIDLPVQNLEYTILWYCRWANPFTDYEVKALPSLQEQAKKKPLLSFLYDHVCDHLTPLFGNTQPNDVVSSDDPSTPRASRLARCGVRFHVSHDPARPYVCFDNQKCELFLPKIEVTDTAVRVIHNLLAYEATARLPNQYAFVSYVHLMDCLIDTADDVQILTDAGIICNKLGSPEELAATWNKFCISVTGRHTVYNHIIMAQLEALSKKRWRRWKASFWEVYWEKSPWLLFSIFGATILLILTVLQTIFTILD